MTDSICADDGNCVFGSLNVNVGSILPEDSIGMIPVRDVPYTLFDEESTSINSRPFTILPGQGVLLSAFNIPCSHTESYDGNFCFSVNKIQFDWGTLPSSERCDHKDACAIPETIIAEEPVMQCGEWILDDVQTMGVISTPGSYRIVASDPSQVGIVKLFLTGLDYDSMRNIQNDMFFGKIGNNC